MGEEPRLIEQLGGNIVTKIYKSTVMLERYIVWQSKELYNKLRVEDIEFNDGKK